MGPGIDDTDEDGVFQDSLDNGDTEQQALVLLKKLQDLKVWQSVQEERLLEEQRNQIFDLRNLGTLNNQTREDDDTTVSSLVYDEELSTLSEGYEGSDNTWAHRNDNRPETKDLNLSNGSVMTLTTEERGETDCRAGGAPTTLVHGSQDESEDEDQPRHPDFADYPDSPSPPNPEEEPVGGGGRTFAQLMSEQLGIENFAAPEPTVVPNQTKKPVEKRPFLRRGTGLARFNLPPDPAQQPSRIKRSRSQPRLSDADNRNPSRLSQETLSFASKKASPKRIVASKSMSKLDEPAGVVAAGTKINPLRKGSQSPPAKLKLKSPTRKRDTPTSTQGPRAAAPKPRQLTTVKSAAATVSGGGAALMNPDPRLQDSVENSFREKLSVQEKKHAKELKELAVFEMLEDAANDSSFCSTSSRVKTLIDHSILPSPSVQQKHRNKSSTPIHSTSTPLHSSLATSSFPSSSTPINSRNFTNEDTAEEDPSLGESLLEDIRRFIMDKGKDAGTAHDKVMDRWMEDKKTIMSNNNGQRGNRQKRVSISEDDIRRQKQNQHDEPEHEEEDDEDYEDDESTVCDEDDDASIGKDWRVRMADWDKENQQVSPERRKGEVLEFSPPNKLPKNSPSYLIWSIFTREREERKLRSLQQRNQGGGGNNYPAEAGPRSAPARFIDTEPATRVATADSAINKQSSPASPLSLASHLENNDDISYHSTLLQMRVVELEQEIDTFKKENTKIVSLKKKLTDEKQRLTKEWEEFDKVREEGKKKTEEERRRVRREKLLLEKAKKETNNSGKVCAECEDSRVKVVKMVTDLSTKESKWTAALSKLQEQVSKMEKENSTLKNENQRLRIKTASSKVASTNPSLAGSKVDVRVVKEGSIKEGSSDTTPDSGIRSEQGSEATSGLESEDEYLDNELRKSISSTVYAALCADTPRMSYSPADSLDSSMTLVSVAAGSSTIRPNMEAPQVVNNSERGTREKRYPDGRLEIWYSNGNRKEVSADGKVVKVYYYNGDLKESHSSGLVKYLYSQTQTWHITHPDSREVLQFSNGQEEIRFPDGSMQISFPDGSIKRISRDGEENIQFPDGTRVELGANGDRVLHLPNGQREEHYKDVKKRVYPDGTVKILHGDGRQETRYSNGRVRIKDGQGKLIQDTQQ